MLTEHIPLPPMGALLYVDHGNYAHARNEFRFGLCMRVPASGGGFSFPPTVLAHYGSMYMAVQAHAELEKRVRIYAVLTS